jgi:molybdopterin-guanine dinucleotide biosynthesis protein A
MKKHTKHTKLVKPNIGEFGRNEWAIIGTVCSDIQRISKQIISELKTDFKLAYVDADHQNFNKNESLSESKNLQTALDFGASLEYTDKIDFHRFDEKRSLSKFQFRQYFNEQDGILINGNHFLGERQIVVIDARKKKSLERKLDRLTNVGLFLLTEGETEIYPFLKKHLPNWQEIPALKISAIDELIPFIKDDLEANKPPLYGLILAGGKSVRMGKDKGLINYHGKPQREYLVDLLSNYCEKTFLSCRKSQVAELEHFNTIIDTFDDLGPFGGMLSAFRNNPNVAWLVIACDLPLINEKAIGELIQQQNHSKIATAFHNETTNFPEPLITIWQPQSYPVLLQFLAQGYACPRKVLINSEIETVQPSDVNFLKNVNKVEEYEAILKLLS